MQPAGTRSATIENVAASMAHARDESAKNVYGSNSGARHVNFIDLVVDRGTVGDFVKRHEKVIRDLIETRETTNFTTLVSLDSEMEGVIDSFGLL